MELAKQPPQKFSVWPYPSNTFAEKQMRMKSITSGDTGADPLKMNRTRPPNFARIFGSTIEYLRIVIYILSYKFSLSTLPVQIRLCPRTSGVQSCWDWPSLHWMQCGKDDCLDLPWPWHLPRHDHRFCWTIEAQSKTRWVSALQCRRAVWPYLPM